MPVSKRASLLAAGIFVLGSTAFGQSAVSPYPVRQADSLAAELAKTSPPDCPDCAAKPSCADLSDNFCKEMWSPENRGNYKVPGGGMIFEGNTEKGGMSQAENMDLRAFLDAVESKETSPPALPPDLKARLAPVAQKLRDLLDSENTSKQWYRALGQVTTEIRDTLKDAGDDAIEKTNPGITKIKPAELPNDKRLLVHDAEQHMLNLMVAAKYQNNPRWKMVQDQFKNAQADLIAEVSILKIPPGDKEQMIEKLSHVNLVLPYSDIRLYQDDEGCSHTEDNAAYNGNLNNFSVCAGLFNSYQDPAALYGVIAHELSHAVDTWATRFDLDFAKTPAGQVATSLCNAAGPVYQCDEWAAKEKLLSRPKSIPEPDYPMKKLSACLRSMDDLADWDPSTSPPTAKAGESTLHSAACQASETMMDQHTRQDDFKDISLPKSIDLKTGELVDNPDYMRPDIIRAIDRIDYDETEEDTHEKPDDSRAPTTGMDECELPGLELYTQVLACTPLKGAPVKNLKALNDEDRHLVVQAALKKTRELECNLELRWFASCGRDCPDLLTWNYSRNAYEDFADWLRNKAFADHYLARLGEDPITTRQALQAGGASLCDPPNASMAPLIQADQDVYSQEPHPNTRLRRMSYFTPSSIKRAHCAPSNDTEKGTGKCDL